MARLILSLDNQVLAEYNMTKERYTIGRLPDNDVRIDNPAVSGHHSLIINILNDSFLEDLNSTNGTYVNGKLIKKHALQDGDVITIGHHQLKFSEQAAAESDQDEFEKTMVIPSGQQSPEQLAKAEQAINELGVVRTLLRMLDDVDEAFGRAKRDYRGGVRSVVLDDLALEHVAVLVLDHVVANAAAAVAPEPAKGSKTTSPSAVLNSMMSAIKSTGFCVWCIFLLVCSLCHLRTSVVFKVFGKFRLPFE